MLNITGPCHAGNSCTTSPGLCPCHGGNTCSTSPDLCHGGNSSSTSPCRYHGGNLSPALPDLCLGIRMSSTSPSPGHGGNTMHKLRFTPGLGFTLERLSPCGRKVLPFRRCRDKGWSVLMDGNSSGISQPCIVRRIATVHRSAYRNRASFGVSQPCIVLAWYGPRVSHPQLWWE
jgi:hypothetical protein